MNLVVAVLREQILFARNYTTHLLDQISPRDWFRQPSEGITHVAWQVGHLAMAEYRLALERVRGRQPDDEALISDAFLAHFSRDSVPDPDPARNPSLEEIRSVFERVHEHTLAELAHFTDDELTKPVLKPHALCKTKREALCWCASHEMLHAGQIGLLRRLLGHAPLW